MHRQAPIKAIADTYNTSVGSGFIRDLILLMARTMPQGGFDPPVANSQHLLNEIN